ncbi:MAG TPA: c-type cytochrome domain-containing protein, partial [Candidatus Eisenbacteria bacterium]|nr:c-type cytochrome domain-containing protein [Candidatus Eisenbacteria bacterium]
MDSTFDFHCHHAFVIEEINAPVNLSRMRGLFMLLCFAMAAKAGESSFPRQSPSSQGLTFERDVRPLLKSHCFECHGEGEKLRGGLDLRLRRLMLQGGESGPGIQPGNAEKSLLIQKVVEGEMPKRGTRLTAGEIAILKKWIAAGAKTARDEPKEIAHGMTITDEERAHWAFQPIRRPAVPKFKTKDRVRTPIDALLLAELSKRKLSFSPDAA